MLFIKDELEKYNRKIEENKKELKKIIIEILKISKNVEKPEKNIYNLKQDILIETKDNLHLILEILDKFEEDMRIKEIKNEFSLENISIKVSNLYTELEVIKNILLDSECEIEEFFKEYNKKCREMLKNSKYILKEIEEKYYTTKFDKNFKILDDNENRKKLIEIEKFYNELVNLVKYYNDIKTKILTFLELTKKFLEQKELVEIALEKDIEEIYQTGIEEFEEKREKALLIKQEQYNKILNNCVGEIYLRNKLKKKFLLFKSKRIIQDDIENSNNLEKVIEKILEYLNISAKERELLENPELILKEKINEEIDIFKFKKSYKICQNFINEELEKNIKLDSIILKNKIQEIVEIFILIKKLLTYEVININENKIEFSNDMKRVLKIRDNILVELEDRIEMKYPHLKR